MPTPDLRVLHERALDDPWSLDRDERTRLRDAHADEQRYWLAMLERVPSEGPRPGPGFPAFLLGLEPWARLGRDLHQFAAAAPQGAAQLQLDAVVTDRLERFLELFAHWSEGARPEHPTGPAAGEELRGSTGP